MTHKGLVIGHLRSVPLFVVLGSEQRAERVSALSGRLQDTWDGPRCARRSSQELCVQAEEINFWPRAATAKDISGQIYSFKKTEGGTAG